MQDYANSLISDSDIFFDKVDDDDDDDPFRNLIPEEEESNDKLVNENLNLLVGNLVNLNNAIGEEPEEIDHGDSEFNIDDILVNANKI